MKPTAGRLLRFVLCIGAIMGLVALMWVAVYEAIGIGLAAVAIFLGMLAMGVTITAVYGVWLIVLDLIGRHFGRKA